MTIQMDGMISDHEWHLLILKAKGKWALYFNASNVLSHGEVKHICYSPGIRQGMSIRVICEEYRPVRRTGHLVGAQLAQRLRLSQLLNFDGCRITLSVSLTLKAA